MSQGFYKRRHGIVEHLESGAISLLDLAVHGYLNLKANLIVGNGAAVPAGVCITSAAAIHATYPKQISERAIQRSLSHLEEIAWIKPWRKRGQSGKYPILIVRSSIHDLSENEYRVNAELTTDWRRPVYEHVAECAQDCPETVTPIRKERSENREVRGTSPTAAQPPSDPRHKLFVDFATAAFEESFKQKPSWLTKDFAQLANLLKKNPTLSLEELPQC